MLLNHTHSPAATSWLAAANGHPDFPIQNLPVGVFRRKGSQQPLRGGVAIGDQVLDLAALVATGALSGAAHQACGLAAQNTLNAFMASAAARWQALRHGVFALLRADATAAQQKIVTRCLMPQAVAEYALPTRIGDYTDFYTSIHHARNVGRIARPDAPLTPNFQWIPIAYHGRSSSVVVSGTPFKRPMGQSMPPGAATPQYGACARLDYEMELGIFVGTGNAQGQPIPLARAEEHIFGMCLLNDWSARDIQFWEMAPLGPFLGKNFCTSISPWIVSMEALAPFRLPFTRPADEPQPLAYLDEPGNRAQGVFDIQLDVLIESAQHRANGKAPSRVSHTSFRHQYWTVAQMVAQHTMGGCNLNSGDLLGTGTISGPTPSEAGAIIELTKGGKEPITLDGGEPRAFLHDGDAVILRGWCEKAGATRIGFGECRGTVLPAIGA
ncbi:MAG: fumarylacetoacetase [Burkholderiaceae bacterium]